MKEASQRFMCVAQKRLCVSSLKSNSHNQPYSTPKCNTTKHPFGCSEVSLLLGVVSNFPMGDRQTHCTIDRTPSKSYDNLVLTASLAV